jgi:protein-tyrosine-phosphatase/DNA-binding transcriptional ArsR family regulator
MAATDVRDTPPAFLRLVAHPVRWRLLTALARSDRAVRELTDMLDEPQSLVSYHLRALRKEGLVTARTSTADARASYYAIDLRRCDDLLSASASALHPGLGLATSTPAARPSSRPVRVLFLCTGNGTRSQIAEALLETVADGPIEAASAGSRPKPVHPNAVRVLQARGIDVSDRQSKHLDRFTGEHFDLVITLCDRVREVCPEPPGWPEAVHWSIPDPGLEGADDHETYPAFERTAAELEQRIRYLLATIDD